MEADCGSFYHENSACYLARLHSLVESSSDSPTTRVVWIEGDKMEEERSIQGITKETFPDLVSLLTFFLRSPSQPQAERKTQPPNLHKTWEGFFSDSLYVWEVHSTYSGRWKLG